MIFAVLVFAMRIILFFLFVPWITLYGQDAISVEVLNVPSNKGKISVALYSDAESFLKFDKVFAAASVNANSNTTRVVLENVPEGAYAIALFYDENGNDELDTNWIGIPKEKVAFSNAKMKLFGPPDFADCVFEHKDKTSISISL